jgi:hypothetical protein
MSPTPSAPATPHGNGRPRDAVCDRGERGRDADGISLDLSHNARRPLPKGQGEQCERGRQQQADEAEHRFAIAKSFDGGNRLHAELHRQIRILVDIHLGQDESAFPPASLLLGAAAGLVVLIVVVWIGAGSPAMDAGRDDWHLRFPG